MRTEIQNSHEDANVRAFQRRLASEHSQNILKNRLERRQNSERMVYICLH